MHTDKFENVVRKLDPENKLIRAWTLTGGVSAQITALEIEQPDGQRKKMIVRQHGEADLKANPHVAADEFKLLQILRSAGLAVPMPYYVDESGEILPSPYIVVEFVAGETVFAPAKVADSVQQMATHLARIHRVNAAELSFLPKRNHVYTDKFKTRPEKLDESIHEGQIRDVLEAVCPLTQHNPSGLQHGDFWLGNILWREGQLAAVIDWEDATLGDPLADIASSRLEILWALGGEAMVQFTQAYQAINPLDFTNLPYWDLCAALRPAFKIDLWAEDESAAERMRERHQIFITQAFKALES